MGGWANELGKLKPPAKSLNSVLLPSSAQMTQIPIKTHKRVILLGGSQKDLKGEGEKIANIQRLFLKISARRKKKLHSVRKWKFTVRISKKWKIEGFLLRRFFTLVLNRSKSPLPPPCAGGTGGGKRALWSKEKIPSRGETWRPKMSSSPKSCAGEGGEGQVPKVWIIRNYGDVWVGGWVRVCVLVCGFMCPHIYGVCLGGCGCAWVGVWERRRRLGFRPFTAYTRQTAHTPTRMQPPPPLRPIHTHTHTRPPPTNPAAHHVDP